MSSLKGRTLFFGLFVLLINSCYAAEIEEFETLSSVDSPTRKEFDNHTQTCFKQFKSSMVKLAVLFLDPGSDAVDSQLESKCWVKCMMEQFKFMNTAAEGNGTEDGAIMPEKVVEKANDLSQGTKSRLSQILIKCESQSRAVTDMCNKAFGFARCVFEAYRGKEQIPVMPVIPVSQPAVLVQG
ncbi:UNVERIFIED_CONTAM: hypothetical protein PYX00_008991 [Menopon gallinae]|uniref:Uncharacterized protein n=1 Tax=Menopon gallinae TaxID=328185 RepID=A0AAW2H9U5_9NEOP